MSRKVRLGISDIVYTHDDFLQNRQQGVRIWEVEVEDDEMLADLWLMVDGLEVLRFPLHIVGAVKQRLCAHDLEGRELALAPENEE